MRKRLVIAVTAVIVVATATYFMVIKSIQNSKVIPAVQGSNISSFNDTKFGLKFSFPNQFKVSKLTEQDKSDKFISRLTSYEPPALVSVRYEEDLRAVAAISKMDLIDLLLNNIGKAYPKRYKNYSMLSEKKFNIGSNDAAELIFSYLGPSGESVKLRQYIIIKDPNTAIFISAQSTEVSFEDINKTLFDPVFLTIALD